jgi:hypothetical protein
MLHANNFILPKWSSTNKRPRHSQPINISICATCRFGKVIGRARLYRGQRAPHDIGVRIRTADNSVRLEHNCAPLAWIAAWNTLSKLAVDIVEQVEITYTG